ncbi:MAG: helix-turn-helix domain-containing protein [Bacteroidales bacterium]
MTKVALFDEELQDMAAIFKVLSHPARLAILKYLSETKVCISGDISDKIPLSRTSVYQHLVELKKIDLIRGEIVGVKTNYCLNVEKLKMLKEKLNLFLADIEKCNNNCCDIKNC